MTIPEPDYNKLTSDAEEHPSKTRDHRLVSLGGESKDPMAEHFQTSGEVKSTTRTTHSCGQKTSYRFDEFMASPRGMISLMGGTAICLIACSAILLSFVTDGDATDCLYAAFASLTAPDIDTDEQNDATRFVSSMIVIIGILFMSAVIGFIVDAIRAKMDALKEGRSKVCEDNHTLILGYTDKTVPLIEELINANASEGGGVIVVLCPEHKVTVEDQLFDHFSNAKMLQGTKLVVRTGSPVLTCDLHRVGVNAARAIIIASSESCPNKSDRSVLRTVLSIRGLGEDLRGYIVAEIRDEDNDPMISVVGGSMVETVKQNELVGRLMASCAFQHGLSEVYSSILGFEGDEFYFREWPELTGKMFGEVIFNFADAQVIGVKKASVDGLVNINPPDDYVLEEGDELMVVAEDDDTYFPGPSLKCVEEQDVGQRQSEAVEKEIILICGWRRNMENLLFILSTMIHPDSEVHMMNNLPEEQRWKEIKDGLTAEDYEKVRKMTMFHIVGDASVMRQLRRLDQIEQYTSAMIVSEADEDDVVQADARSLATLLTLKKRRFEVLTDRESFDGAVNQQIVRDENFVPVCEVLDARTKSVIEGDRALKVFGNYVHTNEIISKVLAMVAERREVKHILLELLAPSGNSIFLRPAKNYLEGVDVNVSYVVLMHRARERGELLIGYYKHPSLVPVINPKNKEEALVWSNKDRFIILGRCH